MASNTKYTVRLADKSEIPSINSFLKLYFHPEETILKCLLVREKNLSADQLELIETDQRRMIETMLQNHPCHVALDEDRKIVGASLLIVSDNPSAQVEPRSVDVYEICRLDSRLVRDYFHRMNEMIERAELFARYPEARRALEFYAVAVDSGHRSRGLATRLMTEGLEFARKNGIDLVFGLYTSPYSRRAAEKVGLREVLNIDMLEYRDSEGEQLFLYSVPHNVASVMTIPTGVQR